MFRTNGDFYPGELVEDGGATQLVRWSPQRQVDVLSFDGTDDFVDIGNPGILQITKSITIEAWVFLNADSGSHGVVTKWNDDIGDQRVILFGFDGSFRFDLSSDGTWQNNTLRASTPATQTWFHAVAVYNDATGDIRLFINGILADSGSQSGGVFDGTTGWLVGAMSDGAEWFIDGSIADVRIWNVARTQQQIQNNKNHRLNVLKQAANPNATTATDQAGDNNGTLANGPIWKIDGPKDNLQGSLSFDGADDLVDVNAGSTLLATTDGRNFTIEMWVDTDAGSETNNSQGISLNIPSDWSNNLFIVYVNELGEGVRTFIDGTNEDLTLGGSINNTGWRHVAVRRDGNTYTLFMDGDVKDTGSNSSAWNSTRCIIGAGDNNGTFDQFLASPIAEVRVWHSARTQTEIQNNMNRRLNGDEAALVGYWPLNDGAGLVGYWPMNEGSGDVVFDSSNGNDGTINGATWGQDSIPMRSTTVQNEVVEGAFYALEFTASQENHVDLPGLEDYGFVDKASFAAWIKLKDAVPSANSATGAWHIEGSGSSNTHYPWTDSTAYFSTFRDNRVNSISLDSSINREQWHLVTITTEPGTNGWKLYQNKTLVFETNGESNISVDSGPFPTLGSSEAGHWLNGWLDKVRVFDRVLGPLEVESLYDKPNLKLGDEVAFWGMTEGSGSTIHSPNGFNGMINGADWVNKTPSLAARISKNSFEIAGRIIESKYFFDDFTGTSLDTRNWITFGETGNTVSVANGELTISNQGGDDPVGIASKATFDVGDTFTVRAKNTEGRHSALVGFGESPWGPFPHSAANRGATWYSRADALTTTYSFEGENGGSDFAGSSVNDLTIFHTLQIKRADKNTVEYYKDGKLVFTWSGILLGESYSFYLSADGFTTPNTIVVDYAKIHKASS